MGESAVDDWVVVARIVGCHGLQGWVKIRSYTHPAENFLQFSGWRVKRREGYETVEFDGGQRQGKGLVVHMAGVNDRTRAESYRGLEVEVPASALPALPEGDYYWRDLQGLEVWCRAGDDRILLGKVDYLIETGANDVLVVAACEGSIDQRERLIPYLPGATVTAVDLAAGMIEVDWFVDE